MRVVCGKLDKAAGDAQRTGNGAGLGDVTAVAHVNEYGTAGLVNFNTLFRRDARDNRVRRFEIVSCVFHSALACSVRVRTGLSHPLLPSPSRDRR